jgi:hypothetical protein
MAILATVWTSSCLRQNTFDTITREKISSAFSVSCAENGDNEAKRTEAIVTELPQI